MSRLPRPGRILLIAGAALLALLLGGRAAAELYTEVLWYDSVGFTSVYWTRLSASVVVQLAAGVVAGAVVLANLWSVSRRLGPVRVRRRYGNIEIAEQIPRGYVITGVIAISVLAGWWLASLGFGSRGALDVLAWLRQVEWGVSDPLFGHDVAFYVFSLPLLLRFVDFGLLILVWSAALVLLGFVLVGAVRWRENRLELEDHARLHLVLLLAGVVLLIGVRHWLGRYELLFGGSGFSGTIGYTDVNIRLPARNIVALLAVALAVALGYGAWKRAWAPAAAVLGTLGVAVLVLGLALPAAIQRFRVEPNQLAMEARYIDWNLDATRQAYELDRMDRRALGYRRGAVPAWSQVEYVLTKLPLWDPEPLDTIFDAIQSLYGYYTFPGVELDRYGEDPVEVGIGVREFDVEGLGENVRTWQTLRLNPLYIRGRGVVVAPAAEIAPDRAPRLWVSDLPPERDPAAPPELALQRASVYFGETMEGYAVVIPGRAEAAAGAADDTVMVGGLAGRDFPEGIRLDSFQRLLAFAWRFGDANLVLSGELNDESRLVFRRALQQRLRAIAPFLLWDPDALPVIHEGRVVWIVDGYTASASYPLARAVDIANGAWVRYIRNSIKATVDGLTGEVVLYAVGPEDPLLLTYARIFPELIRAEAEMPEGLRRHLRYPMLLLRTQAQILQQYHLVRPERFYGGEDYWAVPREAGQAQYRPTYTLLRLPGEERVEFVSTIPFIPRDRENMTALLVARSDPPNYGELLLYELPRAQQVPGPAQAAALIEQDPIISQQFSLWRGGGSDVTLGRMRIVPLDSSFLYIQPVFLSSADRPIPTLEQVVVSDGRNAVMAPSLAGAVAALAGDELPEPRAEGASQEAAALPPVGEWPARALELLEAAERALRAGDWAGFGERWAELQRLLREAASP